MIGSVRDDLQGAIASRIRERIAERGLLQKQVAIESRVTQEQLSRILRGSAKKSRFETVARVAERLGLSMDEMAGLDPELSTPLTAAQKRALSVMDSLPLQDRDKVVEFTQWIASRIDVSNTSAGTPPSEDEPNVLEFVPYRPFPSVEPRRAVRGKRNPERMARRYPAAARPDRGAWIDPTDETVREIPSHYWDIGATRVFKAVGDSMIGLGITDRDLLFVKDDSSPEDGRIVVCRYDEELYVKKIQRTENGVNLLSANRRYGPIIVKAGELFEVIGVVVGRSGYVPDVEVL